MPANFDITDFKEDATFVIGEFNPYTNLVNNSSLLGKSASSWNLDGSYNSPSKYKPTISKQSLSLLKLLITLAGAAGFSDAYAIAI